MMKMIFLCINYCKSKAEESGYTGEVKFIKEHGRVFVYVVI